MKTIRKNWLMLSMLGGVIGAVLVWCAFSVIGKQMLPKPRIQSQVLIFDSPIWDAHFKTNSKDLCVQTLPTYDSKEFCVNPHNVHVYVDKKFLGTYVQVNYHKSRPCRPYYEDDKGNCSYDGGSVFTGKYVDFITVYVPNVESMIQWNSTIDKHYSETYGARNVRLDDPNELPNE
jgi:hypothetical protein